MNKFSIFNLQFSKILSRRKNSGAAMLIVVVFFLFIMLAVITALVSPSVREFRSASTVLNSKKSYFLSESGVEDAYFRLKSSIPIGSSASITLDGNTVNTTITASAPDEKTIIASGNVSFRYRKSELVVNTGVGVSFNYGIHSGTGGFIMGNNSEVNGSVYANGSITGSGAITGTATSANGATVSSDQGNGSGTPAYDVSFGNANGTQDFAQSFQVSASGVVNKVDLYLKKISTPSNLTMRIVNNSGSSPGTTTLASGTLSASLVSTTYGFVSVPFSSNPELSAGTTYWIVIDGATNSSRYYIMGANDGGYAGGSSKIGQYSGSWNTNTPSSLDGFFSLYLGGATGLLSGITVGSGGVGNAYAHTINNSSIAGTAYCQEGSGNNKTCNTSLADPTPIAMPISDQNILDFKSEAEAGGTTSGNYVLEDDSATLGPRKITGNMTIDNNAVLTISGTIWVEGNLVVRNNSEIRLSSSYGTSDGLIVVDGIVDINNNAVFSGSGSSGSYIMVLTTSSSASAITLENNGGAVILYAGSGTINLSNNAGAKALSGKYINLNNNVVINYESGLADTNFVNSPSGSWSVKSWKETE